MKSFFLSVALLSAACTAMAGGRVERDIPYSHNNDPYSVERCRLDVYGDTVGAGRPVVVWFHGGGLTGGSKELPGRLVSEGYVVVAPNYRLIPKVTVSECIDDAASAVAWTFENIERYGGDPSNIFVAGHSAGGYLTSMIGLDRRPLRRHGIEADSIAALIPFSGQAITHFSHRKSQGIGELQPTVDSLAPLFYVRPDCPPYIIITGDREQEIFGRYEENAYLWRMMKLVGHKDVYIYEEDGFNHGDMCIPGFEVLVKHVNKISRQRKNR